MVKLRDVSGGVGIQEVFKRMANNDHEKYEKFNPDLQPKSHVLKISYWIGKDQEPDWIFDKKAEEFFKGLGYKFCGSGFDFAERRRDIEFKRG